MISRKEEVHYLKVKEDKYNLNVHRKNIETDNKFLLSTIV